MARSMPAKFWLGWMLWILSSLAHTNPQTVDFRQDNNHTDPRQSPYEHPLNGKVLDSAINALNNGKTGGDYSNRTNKPGRNGIPGNRSEGASHIVDITTVNNDNQKSPVGRGQTSANKGMQETALPGNFSSCRLCSHDPSVHEQIKKMLSEGTVLIKYRFTFPEYEGLPNPLQEDITYNYKADQWQRIATKHGKTLLSLAFNYDVLSLSLLDFGVEEMSVGLLDTPPNCFRSLQEDAKMQLIMNITMSDFKIQTNDDDEQFNLEADAEDKLICHQIVRDEDGYASFPYQCCTVQSDKDLVTCTDELAGKWVDVLHIIVIVMKIAFILFGPLLTINWLYTDTIGQMDYNVKLSDGLSKTMLVKKVKYADGRGEFKNQAESKQFRKFRSIVKEIPSDEIVTVTFNKLNVMVDHRLLMSEQNVPVGLLRFIYQNIFKCRIRSYEPFLACCKESIFGSWSPRFLWLKLASRFECNLSCRKCVSWGHLFRVIGGLLLIAMVPLPYYLRVVVYYVCEEEEVTTRTEKIKDLGLDKKYEYNIIHYFEPNHAALVLVYVIYGLSFVFLAMLRGFNKEKFDKVAHGAINDLRNISRIECFRLLLAHIVLPFEKFGVCGVFVGLLYWPIALPLCILTMIFYCMPTLYLTGRLLVHGRPALCRSLPCPTSPRLRPKKLRTLSAGATSFETCFLLENINPQSGSLYVKKEYMTFKGMMQRCCSSVMGSVIGFLCVLFMYSLLMMYAETFGFIIEVCVFTLMGAIVNAGNAAKFVMLFFWIILYCTSCYNMAYEKYLNLSKCVFAHIKDKLNDDVRKVTRLREENQKCTAFKYFTTAELQVERHIAQECDSDEDSVIYDLSPKSEAAKLAALEDTNHEESIEYVAGKLHWRINNLIFFVDQKDVPRIPKALFHAICEIEAPGCPGPVHKSLLQATRQFLYMVVFLLFVLIVILAFGAMYQLSSTNQLLITLAGGFLPFVIRFVMTPKKSDLDLNSYSFDGKVHYLITNFSQVWPVFDLSFKRARDGVQLANEVPAEGATSPDHHDGGDGNDGTTRGQASSFPVQGKAALERLEDDPTREGSDTTHVDLFITIRDNCEEELMHNLNMDPGSFASQRSLHSLQHHEDHKLDTAQAATANPHHFHQPAKVNLAPLNRKRSGSKSQPDDSIEMTQLRPACDMPEKIPSNQMSKYRTAGVQTSIGSLNERAMSGDSHHSARWPYPLGYKRSTSRSSSQSLPSSPNCNRPMDLVIDVVGGNVKVRNALQDGADRPRGNGAAKWSFTPPYKKVPQGDKESQC